jgi:hypothetical protein
LKYEHLDAVISRYFVRYPSSLSGQQVSVVHLVCEDGNGKEHARQEIPFTDFPMPAVSLYACWDGAHWVIMLPGEYGIGFFEL